MPTQIPESNDEIIPDHIGSPSLLRDKYNGLYNYEAKIMPEKSNVGITTGYEKPLNLASYKVSGFDTVVSENEHLGEEKCLGCF